MRATAPAGSGCTQPLTPRLSGCQGRLGAFGNRFPLVLGNGREDVKGQLVGVGIVHRHELDARIHEGRHEAGLAREPIRLGNDQLRASSFLALDACMTRRGNS
jgi:hypothetical protein